MNAADRKLRDQFALAAIGSMIIDLQALGEHGAALVAAAAYEVADACMVERAYEPERDEVSE